MADENGSKLIYEIVDVNKKPFYLSEEERRLKAPLSMQFAAHYLPGGTVIVYGGNEYGYRMGNGATHYYLAEKLWNRLEYFHQDLYLAERRAERNDDEARFVSDVCDALMNLAGRLRFNGGNVATSVSLSNSEAVELYDDAMAMWDRIGDRRPNGDYRPVTDEVYAEAGARLLGRHDDVNMRYMCEKVVGALGEAFCVFPRLFAAEAMEGAKIAIDGVGTLLHYYIPDWKIWQYTYMAGIAPPDVETLKKTIVANATASSHYTADDIEFRNF